MSTPERGGIDLKASLSGELTPPDFAPLSDEAWPASLSDLSGGFATKLNVYRVMARHPVLLSAWRDFRNHVVLENSLDDASLEIVILRTGFRKGSRYEWMQHVVRGRQAGLADARIRAVAQSPEEASPDDALLIRSVDALVAGGRLTRPLIKAIAERFGETGVLDLIATVGMYSLLAYVLESFDVPLDADVAAALEEAPLSD